MAGSGSGVYIGNKPVVRVSAVTAKRPVSQASSEQQAYHMIQIGDEIFKVISHPKVLCSTINCKLMGALCDDKSVCCLW